MGIGEEMGVGGGCRMGQRWGNGWEGDKDKGGEGDGMRVQGGGDM